MPNTSAEYRRLLTVIATVVAAAVDDDGE